METKQTPAKNLVTIENFVRAETDNYFKISAENIDAFGKIGHTRELISIDNQDVIRTNQDTLYSGAILDLTNPATITRPRAPIVIAVKKMYPNGFCVPMLNV